MQSPCLLSLDTSSINMPKETNSCIGCKFLFSVGTGYSNWTWEGNDVTCAMNLNPNLPSDWPSDWNENPKHDNWPKTNTSKCNTFAPGPFVRLDVDGDDGPADFTDDETVIALICRDTGRKPNGSK